MILLAKLRFRTTLMASLLLLMSTDINAATQLQTNICNAGIGGTGITQDGIGGTGMQADAGIGGTGQQAEGIGGTGIIGVVTGFASVCVNGLEVHYDQQTSVDVDGQAASIGELNIGQLVAIQSNNKGNQLKAQHISVSHILVGKIEKINTANSTVQIMGQSITISPNTIGGADLKLNQTVKVSGLAAANNRVHALRIDSAAPDTPSSISGIVDAAGAINGTRITSASKINANFNITASGYWDGRTLQAKQIKESAMQRVLKDANHLVIQGIAPATRTQQFKLQNHTISLDANTKVSGASTDSNQVMIVHGKMDSKGNITARIIEYTNENKVLERGGNKHRPESTSRKNSAKDREEENSGKKLDTTMQEKREAAESFEKAERAEGAERPEKTERIEKTERPEKIERPEKTERPERAGRHEAAEH